MNIPRRYVVKLESDYFTVSFDGESGWSGRQREAQIFRHYSEASRLAQTFRARVVRLKQPDGVALIAAERLRQISEEGWTPEHDDEHTSCELAAAAACYALCGSRNYLGLKYEGVQVWPSRWHFKDAGYLRNLAKSGALIAAEMDRELRAQAKQTKGERNGKP